MNSNSDKSENDDVSQAVDIFKSEQTNIDEETLTINDEDEQIDFNNMIDQNLERNSIKRLHLIGGPQSAFARLFPEKYRHEEETVFRNKHRSKSIDIQQYTTTTNDEEENDNQQKETIRRSRRVRFYKDDDDDDDDHLLKNRTKSESYLNKIDLNDNINYDPNPEIIYRDNPDKLIYTQKIGIRYLKPPTPPPPGPILIREIQSTPPNDPPPLIVSSTPPIPPSTPSPLIVREQPPAPPEYQPAKIITKTLPPPPMAPRRVIIKRMPPLPSKPRPVIIEKWLPYKQTIERPILYQRAEKPKETRPIQRNLILQYEPAHVHIKQELQNFGCFRVDPEIYRSQHGSSLRRTESIRRVLKDIGCDVDLITSTGYNTCYSSSIFNQTNKSSSHYDYPKQTTSSTTCFTDEQLDALIGTSVPITKKPIESHYDIPRIYDTNMVTMV